MKIVQNKKKLVFHEELEIMYNSGMIDKSNVNCFCAVLLYYDLILEPEWTEPYDMSEFLKSHFEEITKPELGDLTIFFEGELNTHAAIFVGDNYYWHKPGIYPTMYVDFVTISDVYLKPHGSVKHYRFKD